eukprot:5129310-Pleurochrysis_carterae.AAC.1
MELRSHPLDLHRRENEWNSLVADADTLAPKIERHVWSARARRREDVCNDDEMDGARVELHAIESECAVEQ